MIYDHIPKFECLTYLYYIVIMKTEIKYFLEQYPEYNNDNFKIESYKNYHYNGDYTISVFDYDYDIESRVGHYDPTELVYGHASYSKDDIEYIMRERGIHFYPLMR